MRKDTFASVALVVVLLSSIAVAAVLSDGFDRTRVNLNDAGIWMIRTDEHRVGRVNTEIQTIDVNMPMLTPSDDVIQTGSTVMMVNSAKGEVTGVDVTRAVTTSTVTFDGGASVSLGKVVRSDASSNETTSPEPVAAVVRSDGAVWVSNASDLMSIRPDEDKPVFNAGKGSVVAVDEQGLAHLYDTKSGSLINLSTSGDVQKRGVGVVKTPSVSAVGGRSVVLDEDSGKVYLPNRKTVDLSKYGTTWKLQQPGPASSEVLVGTDKSLVAINLESGSVKSLLDGQRGVPSAPVRLGSCAHGAWGGGTPSSVRVCGNRDPEITDSQSMQRFVGHEPLVFRVNRQRVLLNDVTSGANLLFTPDEPVVVDDWSQARDDNEDQQQPPTEVEPEKENCNARMRDPEIISPSDHIKVGARENRPIIVPVLDLVSLDSHPCDVLNLRLKNEVAAGLGTVVIVDNGASLQITPALGTAGKVFDVPFELTGRTGTATGGRVTVSVAAGQQNSAPVAQPDSTVLILGSKRTEVKVNVVLNDSDPEGDPITLVSAQPSATTSDVTVRYQPDGMVTVSAGSTIGTKVINYQITDDRGSDLAAGTLTVEVRSSGANNPPKARPDRVTAVANRPVTIDVLQNDTDADGDELTVVAIDTPLPGGLTVDRPDSDTGNLRVTATTDAGAPFFFTYQMSDGSGDEPVQGAVRVDVVAGTSNSAPIAVRDDVVVRPGRPSFVDLVANDIDVDGDVLAVTGLVPDDGSEVVQAELFEMKVLRVTPPVNFTGAAGFTYTVNDGQETSTGKLVIRSLQNGAMNLPPLTADDAVTVRAGQVTSVPVLVNDVDPEGEQLTLVSVLRDDQQPTTDGSVRAFVLHDQVHIQTTQAAKAGTYTIGYSASDPVPLSEDGRINLTVLGSDAKNRPPDDPQLEGRVRAGRTLRIKVPLVGLDPDGDVVAVMGVGTPSVLGEVTIDGGVVIYSPDDNAKGGVDRFTIKLDDGRGGRTLGNVSVVVIPRLVQNQNPVAIVDAVQMTAGGEQVIDILANDSDPDGDEVKLITTGLDAPSDPQRGRLEIDGNSITYVQDGSTDGGDLDVGVVDTFRYSISDNRGGIAHAMVTVTILNEVENRAPVARDDLIAPTAPGKKVSVAPLDNDYDPDGSAGELVIELPDERRVEAETGAQIELVGTTVSITIAAGEPRSVSLPYKVVDKTGASAYAFILVPVVSNLPPIAGPDEAKVAAGETVQIDVLANDSDPEQGKERVGLKLLEVAKVVGGEARPGDDGYVAFIAHPDSSGVAGFNYLIQDEGGLQTWGRVNIEIKGQNFAPAFEGTETTVSAGGETKIDLSLLATDENPSDVPNLKFKVVGGETGSIKAVLTGSRNESLTITATEDSLSDTSELQIEVSDGTDTGTGVISVAVSAFEGAKPQAQPDESRTRQGKAVSLYVVANDFLGTARDVAIDPEALFVEDPSSGRVTLNGRQLTFTPAAGYFGWATVRYTLGDSTGEISRRSETIWRVNVIGRPSAPAAPTGVPNDTVVELRWMAPNPNGANITKYLIEAMPGGIRQTSAGTSHTFTGLRNDVAYTFRILAVNEAIVDESEQTNWSVYSQPYTPDVRPEMPSTPTLVFGDKQIQVSWTPPESRGSAVNSYEVQLEGVLGGGGPRIQPFQASVETYAWTGLTNGNTYRFRVRAKNNRDWSEWSNWTDPSDINAVPAGKPLAPTFVQVQPSEERFTVGGTAQVSWVWNRSSHGNGAEVDSFSLVGRSTTSGHTVSFDGPDVRSPFRASGLRNGEIYVFEVVATTKAGPSDKGVSPPIRPSKVPTDIPTSPLSGTDGDASTVLTFGEPPPDAYGPGNGGDPDGFYYSITAAGGAGGPWTNIRTNNPTLTGLTNGATYNFTVRACNTNGCSAQRQISNVRPYTNPGAIGGLTSSISGGTVTWTWNAPSSDGGRPIAHYALSNAGSGNTTSRSYSRGIAEGETLTLCVRAVNSGSDPARTTSGQVCDSETRPRPVATATMSNGDHSPSNTGTCAGVCRYLKLTLSANAPSGTYQIQADGLSKHSFTGGPNGSYQSFGCTACVILYGYNVDIGVTLTVPGGQQLRFTGRADSNFNYSISNTWNIN